MTVICISCRRQHGEHDPTCQHAYDRRYFEQGPAPTGAFLGADAPRPWLVSSQPRPFLATAMRDSMRDALKALHLPGASQ